MRWLRCRLRTLLFLIVPSTALVVWIAVRPPRCQVHGIAMRPVSVPILYGLADIDFEYLDARSARFPNCGDEVMGGCVVQAPTSVTIYVCSQCNTARDAWRVAHPPVSRLSRYRDPFDPDVPPPPPDVPAPPGEIQPKGSG